MEKISEEQKGALTKHRGVFPFMSLKLRHKVLAIAHETHTGKNTANVLVTIAVGSNGITQDVQHFVSKYEHCQSNRHSRGKSFSTWSEAKVLEQLYMDRGYVKDPGNRDRS